MEIHRTTPQLPGTVLLYLVKDFTSDFLDISKAVISKVLGVLHAVYKFLDCRPNIWNQNISGHGRGWRV